MTSSPLLLKDCFFTKINVEPKCGEFATSDIYPLQTRLRFRKNEKGETAVTLGVRKGAEGKDTKQTYFFEFEIVGIFEVDEEVVKRRKLDAEKVVKINAPSLLYGSVREMLCSLTSRGILPMYLLPSMSFVDMREMPKSHEKHTVKPVGSDEVTGAKK